MALIFCDLETTGIDCERDAITEIGWAFQEADILVTRHYAVEYAGFPGLWAARNTSAWQDHSVQLVDSDFALGRFFEDCLRLSDGGKEKVYMVGACPAFDDRFLRKVFREVPYDYHIIDCEAMAMGALGWREPKALRELRAALGIPGENERPHDALSDALEAKLIYDTIIQNYATLEENRI